MKKVKLSVILLLVLGMFFLKIANIKGEEIIDPPIINVNKGKLPITIIVGSLETLDFYSYFEVRDNGEEINLKAGDSNREDDVWWQLDYYYWDEDINDWDFLNTKPDLLVINRYRITLVYNGKDGKLLEPSIDIAVVDEDIKAPVFSSEVRDEYKYEVHDEDDLARFYRRFSAYDDVDGVMEFESNDEIVDIETVNIHELGTYQVKVRFEDNAGNISEKATTIKVEDTKPPSILLKRLIVTKKGKEIAYQKEISYKDNYDSVEDIEIDYLYEFKGNKVEGVDFDKVGEHKVTVTATDSSGNYQIESFRIIVENGLGFWVLILIINGALLVVVGAIIGIRYALKATKK